MGRLWRRAARRVASLPLAARFVRLRAPFVIDSLMAFCVQMGMLTVAYFRGVDYVLLPDGPTPVVLSLIERAAPLDVWGSFFIGAAVLGAIGAHFGRWRICAVGHGMLVAIYLVFGIGSMIDVFGRAELFGFRTGLGWIFGAAVVHAALFRSSMDAWRTANAPEIGTLVEKHPWVLLLIGLAVAYRYIGQVLAEGSQFWAKVLPFGQTFRHRAERRRSGEAADLVDLRRQVKGLGNRVRIFSHSVALYDDYLMYDARWHRDHNIYAAEQGYDFPPPAHISFHDYMAARMPSPAAEPEEERP